VFQMCAMLLRTENDYVPVVDAESGNLVSILGFLDVVQLLNQASMQYPNLFARSIRDAGHKRWNWRRFRTETWCCSAGCSG
jgi:hypothetical protein